MTNLKQLEIILKDLIEKKELNNGMVRASKGVLREISVINSCGSFTDNITNYEKNIQIGGGSHVLEGFTNIDIFPPADIIHDVRESLPLRDNSVKTIFTEHFLEHIDYPVSVNKFLEESFRSLEECGKLIIGVPNAGLFLKKYTENDIEFFKKIDESWYGNRSSNIINTPMDTVNMVISDEYDHDRYTPHYWGYDFANLEALLKKHGFKNIELWDIDYNLINAKREFGSVYIKGEK